MSCNENMDPSRADNAVANWQKLPNSNPEPDLYNINTHTNFGRNPFMFTQVYHAETKKGRVAGR